ncbi:hypothetical protein [Microbacterium sp. G2-8]|uniref:hypothetical protein n=1 Tax=Microbacterium sp. G2-8 TaxID=2842454 RepID=UPI001C8A5B09|nr:hypothetical protein [Microbacterium sp. G2-8]
MIDIRTRAVRPAAARRATLPLGIDEKAALITNPTISPASSARGGRKLALTAFVLALLGFLLPPVTLLILVPIDGSGSEPIAWMMLAPVAAIAGVIMSVASLIVAIVCLVRRARGRGWAIAALVLDVVVAFLAVGAIALFIALLSFAG